MIRSVCCLALTSLFAACAAPKAEVVEDTTPATKPVKPQQKPQGTIEKDPTPSPLMVRQNGGMRLPNLEDKLPEKRDMVPTVTPANSGGSVVATPPTDESQARD